MPDLRIEGVTKVYDKDVLAVDHVDLKVADGEFLVLVGPSGCGKSTLLRIIAGLEATGEGRVLLGGIDVTRTPPQERDIAMVFQNYALYPHMSVRKNLGYGLRVHRVAKNEIKRRVEQTAHLLGLTDLLDRRPGALSGGQKQRVAMGRAIAREPAMFLMDEPLSNLDAKLRVTMRAELTRLHKRIGTTTIYVTHDQVEAMTLGHRVAVMRDGRVQQLDTPRNIYNEPANVFVATFVGSPPMNLVEAVVAPDGIAVGQQHVALPVHARPAAEIGERIIAGIRPEDVHLSESGDSDAITVEVLAVEELGSRSHAFISLDGLRPELDPAISAVDNAGGLALLRDDSRVVFTAELSGKQLVQAGEYIEIAFDPTAFHFFSRSDHTRLNPISQTQQTHEQPFSAGRPQHGSLKAAAPEFVSQKGIDHV